MRDRLNVFLTAARTLSFTRCAEQLYISQPAVSKNIAELEAHFGKKLFIRNGSRLELTEAGTLLLGWSERILALYNRMEYEIGLLGEGTHGNLRIGASTTIAQYVLPYIIARFHKCYPDVSVTLVSDNSQNVEQSLFSGEIDLGFVENISRRAGLRYETFMEDRLVLVAGKFSDMRNSITVRDLQHVPLVLRENGSGTLESVRRTLDNNGISVSSLNTVACLGSTEAIKTYVEASDACAILSVAAIEDELSAGTLKIIEIEGLSFERQFAYVTCQGDSDPLVSRFIQFASNFA